MGEIRAASAHRVFAWEARGVVGAFRLIALFFPGKPSHDLVFFLFFFFPFALQFVAGILPPWPCSGCSLLQSSLIAAYKPCSTCTGRAGNLQSMIFWRVASTNNWWSTFVV